MESRKNIFEIERVAREFVRFSCNVVLYRLDADQEYQRIVAYKKSYEFVKKQNTVNKNKAMYSELASRAKPLTLEEKKLAASLKKITDMDTMDIQATDSEHDMYLHLAVEHYLECILLEAADEFDVSLIFRLLGLWIGNQSDEEISRRMADKMHKIPAYKFVPLMPQMTAHLGSACAPLSATIAQIVRKCSYYGSMRAPFGHVSHKCYSCRTQENVLPTIRITCCRRYSLWPMPLWTNPPAARDRGHPVARRGPTCAKQYYMRSRTSRNCNESSSNGNGCRQVLLRCIPAGPH